MIDLIMLACPTSVLLATSLAMSAAGAVVSYVGAAGAAKRQEEYQDHLSDLQRKAAQRRAVSVHIRTAQEREATAMRMQTVSEEAAKVASQARLSIAEGLSLIHI